MRVISCSHWSGKDEGGEVNEDGAITEQVKDGDTTSSLSLGL